MVWGLDLVGPLKKAPEGYTHLLVPVDKFTKWIEARPISAIKSEQAVLFFLDIIHRFGVPNSIITDNGTQFTSKKFIRLCDEQHIRVDWAAVAHPRTNGQVERANGMLLPVEQVRRTLGHQAPCSTLEPENNSQPSHRLHTVLHGLRCQGRPPDGPRLWSAKNHSVR